MGPIVKFRKLHESAIIPEYQTAGAAGMDLVWFDPDSYDCHTIWPGEGLACETRLSIEIPDGYEGQVRPRSGLAKQGITVVNAPGTIDSDFRGELIVLLGNIGTEDVTIRQGDRIAQLVIAPVVRCEIRCVDELSCTARATGGFGSTGR